MVRRRWILAGLALSALVWPAAATAQQPLLPDLTPLKLVDGETVDVYFDGGRTILDVGFRAPNIGDGPLELVPLPEPPAGDPAADCDGDGDAANDRPERQNVYLDEDGNGVFDRSTDTTVEARGGGCSVFHPAHNHWHAAVMSVDLISLDSGQQAGALDKLTFCVVDLVPFDLSLPGFDPDPYYAACSPTDPEGISPGWYDEYSVGLAGQQLDVTDLEAGSYCVRQVLDSTHSIDELDDANNVAETRIDMDPATSALQVRSDACAVATQGGPPVVDSTAPDTTLLYSPRPRFKTLHRWVTVRFDFGAAEPNSTLECSIDGGSFASCSSPVEARLRARRGTWTDHSFQVRALDAAGNADTSPASWTGQVKRRKKNQDG